jgi:hypothetical protein
MAVMAQPTLCIVHHTNRAGTGSRLEIIAELPDLSPLINVDFNFDMTPQDLADLRWYLEDYLEFPEDPALLIARRVEARMAEIGDKLFDVVFDSSDTGRELWTRVRARLADVRIEVVTDLGYGTIIPWELIRDPSTNALLALNARAFVRNQRTVVECPEPRKEQAGKVRILLIICRPQAGRDVPFRSVASRLVVGLDNNAPTSFELDVLRPPTYEALGGSPRRARRFVNVYRVAKASLTPTEIKKLEDGEHRALATQLAITTGAPNAFGAWVTACENTKDAHIIERLHEFVTDEAEARNIKGALAKFRTMPHEGEDVVKRLAAQASRASRFSFVVPHKSLYSAPSTQT